MCLCLFHRYPSKLRERFEPFGKGYLPNYHSRQFTSCVFETLHFLNTFSFSKKVETFLKNVLLYWFYRYSLQPENAIPIKTWFNDPKDDELFALLPIVKLNILIFVYNFFKFQKYLCNIVYTFV